MPEPEITDDALLGGTVRLLQVRKGHRAGTDAVLLAALCGARDGDRVADLGAASGAVGLMVAARIAAAHVAFLDRDPTLIELCRRNAQLNGLDGRADATVVDALAGLPPADLTTRADLVVTNPPFFDADAPASPDPGRRAAHHMARGEGGDASALATWLDYAAGLLRARGRIAIIHRADALDRCLAALGRRFGSIEIVPIHSRRETPANRIVLRAMKGGRAALRLEPAIVLHGAGGPTTFSVALHAAPCRAKGAPLEG